MGFTGSTGAVVVAGAAVVVLVLVVVMQQHLPQVEVVVDQDILVVM